MKCEGGDRVEQVEGGDGAPAGQKGELLLGCVWGGGSKPDLLDTSTSLLARQSAVARGRRG